MTGLTTSAIRPFLPGGKDYDMCRGDKGDHDRALAAIAKTRPPRTDPVFGRKGPLKELWR